MTLNRCRSMAVSKNFPCLIVKEKKITNWRPLVAIWRLKLFIYSSDGAYIKMLLLDPVKKKRWTDHVAFYNFPKLFTVRYVSNSFDFLKDPIYWVIVILENENRTLSTCLQFFSLLPSGKNTVKKKKRKTDFAFIISLNFLRFTTFQIAFILKRSRLIESPYSWSRKTVHCPLVFNFFLRRLEEKNT